MGRYDGRSSPEWFVAKEETPKSPSRTAGGVGVLRCFPYLWRASSRGQAMTCSGLMCVPTCFLPGRTAGGVQSLWVVHRKWRDSSILSRFRDHLPERTAGRVWVLRNSPLVRWMVIHFGLQCLWLWSFPLSRVHALCLGISRSANWGSACIARPLWEERAPRRVWCPLCWWQSKSSFLWSAWSVISARGSCGAGLLRGPQAWGLLRVWAWPTPTTQWSILKADVTKAHRRIKIHQEDWKFQVAHIGDEWWVNKVGTYGMASAQLYWGRMAALLLRIVYAVFPGIDWGFVFVDDFAWLIREPQSAIYSTAILVLLLSLGTPLSWKKTVLNPVNTWLGFVIDPTGPIVQMATDKNSLVINLLDKLAAGDVFTLKDLEKGMGRLQWATSACPLTKPLLQPLWQWKGVLRSSGRPNHLLRVFARMLRLLFQEPYVQPTPYAPWSPWHGASDASASHHKEYYIGGWLSSEPTPSKGAVHWCHLRLEESNYPWLFKTKTASAMIPALELLGSLILITFILRMGEKHQLAVRIPVITDNQGNVFCMLNNKTRQMPTAAILMQLVLTLHKGGAQLAPSHVKRDLNQWADELTHPNPTGFNPDYYLDAKSILNEFTLMNWVLKEIYHYWGPSFSSSSSPVASCTDRGELPLFFSTTPMGPRLDARCQSALQVLIGVFQRMPPSAHQAKSWHGVVRLTCKGRHCHLSWKGGGSCCLAADSFSILDWCLMTRFQLHKGTAQGWEICFCQGCAMGSAGD